MEGWAWEHISEVACALASLIYWQWYRLRVSRKGGSKQYMRWARGYPQATELKSLFSMPFHGSLSASVLLLITLAPAPKAIWSRAQSADKSRKAAA